MSHATLLLLGVSLLFGCGDGLPGFCGPSNCNGCCAGGVCQAGSAGDACGGGGAACLVCPSGQACGGSSCRSSCARPWGVYVGTANRTKVVSGNAASAFCPTTIGDELEINNGYVQAPPGNVTVTGAPVYVTTTYGNNGCRLQSNGTSSGCVGGVCRAWSLAYELTVSQSGKSLTGAMLSTMASDRTGETCTAEYTLTLVTP